MSNKAKSSVFSRPGKPYKPGYVPEEEYVEKMNQASAQINAMVKMIETAQSEVVTLCQRDHGWEDCTPTVCPRVLLRSILHIPAQSKIESMINRKKLEVSDQEINSAITRAAQRPPD